MRDLVLDAYRRVSGPLRGRGLRRWTPVDRLHRAVVRLIARLPDRGGGKTTAEADRRVRFRLTKWDIVPFFRILVRHPRTRGGPLLRPSAPSPSRPDDEPGWLRRYEKAFGRIQGWFGFDAALLFVAYASLLARHGIRGDTLEVGVHHGLSAIAVAALRGPGRRFVAIDLFEELQRHNVSRSGSGSRDVFERNLAAYHGDTSFARVIAAPSSTLRPEALGDGFSFVHLDGGHSFAEVTADLDLAARILVPGGILALDDYFNPEFPGVGEAALAYARDHAEAFLPLAVGFNKVLLQKAPAPFDLNASLLDTYPDVSRMDVALWRRRVPLFGAGFAAAFDLERSTCRALAPTQVRIRARLRPLVDVAAAAPGERIAVPVAVENRSSLVFESSEPPVALSYHLLAHDGRLVRHDNARTYFEPPIRPGEERVVAMTVDAPEEPDAYVLEVDIVWEHRCWFEDRGSPTARVRLIVG